MSTPGAAWAGCHGVRTGGTGNDRFGSCSGEPIAQVEILPGAPAAPGRTELWSQRLPDGTLQRMTVGENGQVVLELGQRRVSCSPGDGPVIVGEPYDWVTVQLVASFVLPFLVSGANTLVLHAAAACRADRAVLLTGPGGTGKSSSLVGLVDAGWTPLSEDVCVIDLAGPVPLVWPGPPWVRRRHGESGPTGASVLFESSEKTAWDLSPFRDAPGPAPVTSLLVLEPPLDDGDPRRRTLTSGEAIGAIAPHAVWLGDRDQSGRRLFAPVADAAARLPVSRLQLPVRDDWVDLLVSTLDEAAFPD